MTNPLKEKKMGEKKMNKKTNSISFCSFAFELIKFYRKERKRVDAGAVVVGGDCFAGDRGDIVGRGVWGVWQIVRERQNANIDRTDESFADTFPRFWA